MNKLVSFLEELEEKDIYYKLNKIRDAILVEVVIPGERWEVEFFQDDSIVVEKFVSDGILYDEKELEVLFREF